MTQIAADDFTYADATDIGTVAPNWSLVHSVADSGRVGVLSNQAYPFNNTVACHRWNADEFPADQYAEATIVSWGTNEKMGLSVRCASATEDYYYARFSKTNVILLKAISGAFYTLVTQGMTAPTPPFAMRLEVIGSTVAVSIDGSGVVEFTDSEYASGYPGIVAVGNSNNPHTLMDDWSAGEAEPGLFLVHPEFKRVVGRAGRPGRIFRR